MPRIPSFGTPKLDAAKGKAALDPVAGDAALLRPVRVWAAPLRLEQQHDGVDNHKAQEDNPYKGDRQGGTHSHQWRNVANFHSCYPATLVAGIYPAPSSMLREVRRICDEGHT